MTELHERLWDFDQIQPGQSGTQTVVQLTAEHITRYAWTAQNKDSRYVTSGVDSEFEGKMVAMPTMLLTYAPLLRDNIADNNGFVAVEESKTARRQTPFAKCEARWFKPVFEGDTLTGTRRVLEKFEKRGNKFVTFRVEANNQSNEKVAHFDYTCIFSYAKGQRDVPVEAGTAIPEIIDDNTIKETVNIADFVSFSSSNVGDVLKPLTISESAEIMIRKNDFTLAGKYKPSNIHTDEDFANKNIFAGVVNSGPATMSYVDQMLERNFPLSAFYNGGSLLMRAITPFRSGDTVTFEGEITSKNDNSSEKSIDVRVKGTNQRGDLVSLSDATMVFEK
tara:strand:- start:2627 stop:3631 length:1005 start_codon:yes stop_codon:yes gene_type:complete